jgi:hypothetical protein
LEGLQLRSLPDSIEQLTGLHDEDGFLAADPCGMDD